MGSALWLAWGCNQSFRRGNKESFLVGCWKYYVDVGYLCMQESIHQAVHLGTLDLSTLLYVSYILIQNFLKKHEQQVFPGICIVHIIPYSIY